MNHERYLGGASSSRQSRVCANLNTSIELRSLRMKNPRQSSYPMPLEDAEELPREFSEFGYRESDDPEDADRRRYYKVE